MNQGGDTGKSPNATGTQPKHRTQQTLQQPKKIDQGRAGQGSANSRTPSPKKTPSRTYFKTKRQIRFTTAGRPYRAAKQDSSHPASGINLNLTVVVSRLRLTFSFVQS